jgi:hypothetical protein
MGSSTARSPYPKSSKSPDHIEIRHAALLVPGHERKPQVQRCGRDDSVGHVGDAILINSCDGINHAAVYRCQNKSPYAAGCWQTPRES